MSYDISSISRFTAVTPPQRPSRSTAGGETASGASAAQDAVTVDTMPSAPPDDVLGQVAAAAQAHDRLLATGRQVHFGVDQQTGALSIELHDSSGAVLGTVAPSQVLELATGGTLA